MGKQTYSKEKQLNKSTKRKKIAIISDSMTKPIDMREFNNIVEDGDAIKRAYGGAMASWLKLLC